MKVTDADQQSTGRLGIGQQILHYAWDCLGKGDHLLAKFPVFVGTGRDEPHGGKFPGFGDDRQPAGINHSAAQSAYRSEAGQNQLVSAKADLQHPYGSSKLGHDPCCRSPDHRRSRPPIIIQLPQPLPELVHTSLDDLPQDTQIHCLGRESDQVHGGFRCSAHGVNIAQGIGGGNLAEPVGIVHNRREKIHRLYQRQIIRNPIDTGVVGPV